MWKASSRFCLLVLVLALDRLTRLGLRAFRMARNKMPLLQLALKSFMLKVQPALKKKKLCFKVYFKTKNIQTRFHSRTKEKVRIITVTASGPVSN